MKNFILVIIALFSFLSFADETIDLGNSNAIEHHSYYFNDVQIYSRSNVKYKITNTGTTPLAFAGARISGANFSAYHTCKKGLQPKETCWFQIEFWPMFEGMHMGRFDIKFDQETEIIVDVFGNGVR